MESEWALSLFRKLSRRRQEASGPAQLRRVCKARLPSPLEQGSTSSALLTLEVREFSAVGGLFCAF